MLKYPNATRNLCLTLTGNNVGIIKIYMDAYYAIHYDCCGHTGANMTFGEGAVTSFHVKLNANSTMSGFSWSK